LQSLKIQLQPHFLFNTLNSISALMHINVKAADKMISELSDLLRLSLENRDVQESTVRQELDFVQGYLRIEQTRFSDRLTVVFDIEPETYDARLPHMLIQPLAENAVRHGIAKRSFGGRIEIASRRRGHQLVISIVDNGSGFDLSSLPASGSGVGLKNTRERLRKLYGDQQELITLPAISGGVEVRVCLPFAAAPEADLEDKYSLVMGGLPDAHSHGHC
jgi:LytS/YehU family sensor histidine kinase